MENVLLCTVLSNFRLKVFLDCVNTSLTLGSFTVSACVT